MPVNMGSSGKGTQKGHGEGVSPRPAPSRQSDNHSSGRGTRQFDQNPDAPLSTLKPSIDKSGTSTVSGSVPETRKNSDDRTRERAG